MKIVFSALGFSTASAFISKDGRQLQFGSIRERYSRNGDEYEFWAYDYIYNYVKEGYITKEEIPTGEQAIAEYIKQLAAQNGAPSINKEIQYAG